jgi:hypothetical protein
LGSKAIKKLADLAGGRNFLFVGQPDLSYLDVSHPFTLHIREDV